MPYELTFVKGGLVVADADLYINECCWGGDIVVQQLLPKIKERYEVVDEGQEDWGWYIQLRKGVVALAVDVFCDDPKAGEFRVHLTSRLKRLLILSRVADTPELDEFRDLVVPLLNDWLAPGSCKASKIEHV